MNLLNHKSQVKIFIGVFFLSGVIVGKYLGSLEDMHSIARISPDSIEVCFSPNTNCSKQIIKMISTAQKTIFVQSYTFTAPSIAEALIKTYQKGVEIIVLTDRSQKDARNTQLYKLLHAGISVLIDHVPGVAHNKIMIIDDSYVITGSFNWTNAAEYKNAENVVIINNNKLNQIYRTNFEKRLKTATKLDAKIHTIPQSFISHSLPKLQFASFI